MAKLRNRYDDVSVFLHWSIAGLLLLNILVAWVMESDRFGRVPFVVHVSVGLTVLLLSLARLGWRLTHPWLPLPASMPGWEKLLARANHVAFYVMIIAIPLLGWATASSSPRSGEFLPYLGFIPWPTLPIAASEALHERLGGAHGLGVLLTVLLVLLHVAGAVMGTYFERRNILGRMIPGFQGLDPPDAEDPAKPAPGKG